MSFLWSVQYFTITYNNLDFPKGAKWFLKGVKKAHPLGFNWHPFEGAGMYITNIGDLFFSLFLCAETHRR